MLRHKPITRSMKKLWILAAALMSVMVPAASNADDTHTEMYVIQCYHAADCDQLLSQIPLHYTTFAAFVRAHHKSDLAILSFTLNPESPDPTGKITTMQPAPLVDSDDPEHRLKSVAERGV